MRPFFILALLLFVLSTTPVTGFENVLLISVDTLRADYVGCNGSKKVKTPHIDSLCNSGVTFRNTVSPAPYTLPSHVSLLTGMIPPAHGVQDNAGFYLDDRVHTLAEILKFQGMKTAAFVSALPLDSRFGIDQGFDVYDDRYPASTSVNKIVVPERKAEEVIDVALDWLQTQKNQKWFAFVHLYDPHAPYIASAFFEKLYPKDLYAAEVAYADQQVGRLLDFLNRNNLRKKTLIIFTSDHGESLGEHEEESHGIFAYESTLRVPLIMAPFAPKAVRTRVRLVDVTPTILDLQGIAIPQKLEGVSLKQSLEGMAPVVPPLHDSYFESLSMYFNAGWAPLRGFYSENYKFIDLPVPELYNLKQDPAESKNLCSDPALCGIWKKKFQQFFKPYESNVAIPAQVNSETREQLQALGYVAGTGLTPKKTHGPKDDPKELVSLHNRAGEAVALFNGGKDLQALQILEQLMIERPDYGELYLHASFIHGWRRAPEKGVALLQQAKRYGISGPAVDGKLGLYLYESGKYEQAVTALQEALKANPQDLDHLNFLAMSYAGLRKYSEAETILARALKIDATDAMTLSNFGMLSIQREKFESAEKYFLQAIASNPTAVEAYEGLGQIYSRQLKWDLAVRYLSLAMQADQNNFDVLLNLALAYLKTNQNRKALELLQRFERDAPPERYHSMFPKVRALIQKLTTSSQF